MIYSSDLSKIFCLGTILFHIFSSSVTEKLRSTRSVCDSSSLLHHLIRCHGRIRSIVEICLQAARVHLLEADNKNTIGSAICDSLPCHLKTGRSSAAVVVDIVDWNLAHAELVEDSLTTGRVAILYKIVSTDGLMGEKALRSNMQHLDQLHHN